MSEQQKEPLTERNELDAQELKLKSKYGNIEKRRGAPMLVRKLQGRGVQYFDSADYSLQKAGNRNLANPIQQAMLKKQLSASRPAVSLQPSKDGPTSPKDPEGKIKKRLSSQSSLADNMS